MFAHAHTTGAPRQSGAEATARGVRRRSVLGLMALGTVGAALGAGTGPQAHAATSGADRIHIMAFPNGDAIILESEGRFGFVDSGEDDAYPDGTDPRYPLRDAVVTSNPYEEVLWDYLERIGVNDSNVDFYIGTHAHSDHIGTADEVIRRYRPARVYTPEYSDAWISDSSRLWDNQYVYDTMIQAAQDTGAALIQHLDPSAPTLPTSQAPHTASPTFELGSMSLEIVNYGEEYKTTPVYDADHMCWGVTVTANGARAFLAADIEHTDGAEARLAAEIGGVDLLKMGHHGLPTSSSDAFLEALAPAYAVQTGYRSYVPDSVVETLERLGTQWYCAEEVLSSGASVVVATLADGAVGMSTRA